MISRFNLFYGKRKDQQVKVYSAEQFEFTDYLTNAAEGHYYGLEAELDYYPTDNVHFYASLDLLTSDCAEKQLLI